MRTLRHMIYVHPDKHTAEGFIACLLVADDNRCYVLAADDAGTRPLILGATYDSAWKAAHEWNEGLGVSPEDEVIIQSSGCPHTDEGAVRMVTQTMCTDLAPECVGPVELRPALGDETYPHPRCRNHWGRRLAQVERFAVPTSITSERI
jgi:hypothetical protein